MLSSFPPAVLALSDGTIFKGYSIGLLSNSFGEVVFNTAMTGYQEILSDPSYANQIVVLTCSHIGNVGVNEDDNESTKSYLSGLVIRDLPVLASNFRMKYSLSYYLNKENIVGIAGIDTRKLTRILRDKGSQNGAIVTGKIDIAKSISLARSHCIFNNIDILTSISSQEEYKWTKSEYNKNIVYKKKLSNKYHVVVIDYGVKQNILRMLFDRFYHVTVLPAKTSIDKLFNMKPDGIFLSNGPGDPKLCDYGINLAKECISHNIPTFGICLGHQIIGLAIGANTIKMKTGHHGVNHPVKDLINDRVFITSQNHGFTIDINSLPDNAVITHISLFDGTLQGFMLIDKPVFSFQGHPEASPGPHDLKYLFDDFLTLINNFQNKI